MVAIVKHNLQHNRSNCEVLRIMTTSLQDKTSIKYLYTKESVDLINDGLLSLIFSVDNIESHTSNKIMHP